MTIPAFPRTGLVWRPLPILAAILVVGIILLASCDLGLFRPAPPLGGDGNGGVVVSSYIGRILLQAGPGAMLLRHGDFLYCLGGEDDLGQLTASVRALRLDNTGEPVGEWFDVASLPVPLRDGAAFGLGHFIQVVGGLDADGVPVDTVWYAYADPADGQLGFPGSAAWTRHSRSLPEGRAGAAWAIHDGRLFLAGGSGPSGPTADILYAGFSRDGYLGYWFRSRASLSHPVRGAAAAVLIDEAADSATLFIAGGEGPEGLLAQCLTLRIGSWGLLGEYGNFYLPVPLSQAVLVPGRTGLVLAGGCTAVADPGPANRAQRVSNMNSGRSAGQAANPAAFMLYGNSTWTAMDGSLIQDTPLASLAGPGHALVAGRLLALAPDGTVRSVDGNLDPEAPQVLPGSGIVPARTYVRVRPEPGTVLRYRISNTGPVADVGPEDPVWQPPYQLQSTVDIAFRAFAPDGRSSPLVRRSYQVRSMGMFLHTEFLPVRSPADAQLRALVPGWYYFRLIEPAELTLRWELPQKDGAVLAPAHISVFEPDLCTPVPDADGALAVLGLDATASPVRLWLPAGTFYLQVQAPATDPDHPGILASLIRDGD